MSNEQSKNALERLREIAVRQRHAVEHAEARAEEILQLSRTLGKFISSRTFVGGFLARPYSEQTHRTDSGFLSQAALNLPNGLGVVSCDTEQYQSLKECDELHTCFRPFNECDIAEKAFLNSEAPALLLQLEQAVTTEQPAR